MKNVQAVLSVKFKTILSVEELVKAINANVQGYKNVPGQLKSIFCPKKALALSVAFTSLVQ